MPTRNVFGCAGRNII